MKPVTKEDFYCKGIPKKVIGIVSKELITTDEGLSTDYQLEKDRELSEHSWEEIHLLLEKRAKTAETFLGTDKKIRTWLEKNNIEVGEDHILTGACSLCEPWGSIEHIKRCIADSEV